MGISGLGVVKMLVKVHLSWANSKVVFEDRQANTTNYDSKALRVRLFGTGHDLVAAGCTTSQHDPLVQKISRQAATILSWAGTVLFINSICTIMDFGSELS